MAEYHVARKTELEPEPAHLVLEELAQRLDQAELHLLRQPADVVMRLDDMRLACSCARRFDHVRIDRALRQPAHAFELVRFLFEHLDEEPPYYLALVLGVRDATQTVEKPLL